MKKRTLLITNVTLIIVLGFVIIGFTFLGLYLGFHYGVHQKIRYVHCNFTVEETVQNANYKYTFLTKDVSDYICNLSKDVGIDPDFAVAILMQENPEFNPQATHRNGNGTFDTGLFQLNDRSLYEAFLRAYWDIPIEFNTFNWQHNTFIAIHHLAYLQASLGEFDKAVCAYNCGEGRVRRGVIPTSTQDYLLKVQMNYDYLKTLQ